MGAAELEAAVCLWAS
ncbi:hypothetical protein ADUPG1_003682, partial [Aduncisulcus paluster]